MLNELNVLFYFTNKSPDNSNNPYRQRNNKPGKITHTEEHTEDKNHTESFLKDRYDEKAEERNY